MRFDVQKLSHLAGILEFYAEREHQATNRANSAASQAAQQRARVFPEMRSGACDLQRDLHVI